MIHVLAAGCNCSAAVAQYLAQRHARTDLSETVWLVGADEPLTRSLAAAGFAVETKQPETLAAETKIEGAPWLLIMNPKGELVYSGGYAPENPASGTALQDLALLSDLRSGGTPKPYPALGCAVSRHLQDILDPLGLKYTRR